MNLLGAALGSYVMAALIRPNIVFPVRGYKVTSPYGFRKFDNEDHTGIDLVGGNKAYAVLDGKVIAIYRDGQVSGYGNLVIVRHNNKLYSLYAHLGKILVHNNQRVIAGDIIGNIGTTGATKANPKAKVHKHLHFEFLSKWPPDGKDLNRINPKEIFGDRL